MNGSNWDPDSVMHYPFEAGLITQPQRYATGLNPAGGLSTRDRDCVRKFYQPLSENDTAELRVGQSVQLDLVPMEQRNFIIKPQETRSYQMRTFGVSDTVMVLFEQEGADLRYLTADDDSGEDRNAELRIKLLAGRSYVLRLRLYFSNSAGQTAVMLW